MTKTIKLGEKLPLLSISTTSDSIKNTQDFLKKNVVLYFYPKDDTSGCTKEAENFRDAHSKFTAKNTLIIGLSRDSIKSHHKFIEKFNLSFPLISDAEEILCQLFDVIKKKKLYGKEYMGIERSTFIFDEHGVLKKEWRNVKVEGHVDEVLEAIKALN